MREPGNGGGGPGVVQSLRTLAATLIDALHTRAELIVTEIEEGRVQVLQLLLWAAAALFFLGLSVLLFVILVVAYFWDTHRIVVIATLACLCLAVGVGLALGARNRMAGRPRLFSASLDELARDRDQLRPR